MGTLCQYDRGQSLILRDDDIARASPVGDGQVRGVPFVSDGDVQSVVDVVVKRRDGNDGDVVLFLHLVQHPARAPGARVRVDDDAQTYPPFFVDELATIALVRKL